MAVASGRAGQYLQSLPRLSYDGHGGAALPSLYVSEQVEFLVYRALAGVELPVASNGTGGKWGLWVLYPVRCTRAQVKAVYEGLQAHNATLPAGSTLGPFAPKNLPTAGKVLIGGIMPMVIAGDDPVAQMELDEP